MKLSKAKSIGFKVLTDSSKFMMMILEKGSEESKAYKFLCIGGV
jgi:hypothetical protein